MALDEATEITGRLLALNAAIATGEAEYAPFPALEKPTPPQREQLF